MAEQDQPSQVDAVELSDSEESGQDDRSDGEGERLQLTPQVVFKKMLHVATRMNQKDRQQQKFLLSLAMQAIDKVNTDSRSDVGRKKKRLEAARVKDTAKKETQGKPLGSLYPTSSRVEKKWLPEDFALVKNLRAKNIRWIEIGKRYLPGRTGNQIRARYIHWLKTNMDLEDEEEMFDETESDRAEELESEIVFRSHAQVDLPARKATNEGIPQAPPALSAFEIKRKANMAENQALLDQIAPPMDGPRQMTKEKRKRLPTPSTPPNPIRRSERKVSARRTV